MQAEALGQRSQRVLRHDADPEPMAHHLAHDLEAAHLHTQAQEPPRLARPLRQEPVDRRSAVERDEFLVDDVGETQGWNARERMPGRHRDGQPVGGIGEGQEPFGRRAPDDDADIGEATLHRFQRLGRRTLLEIEPDVGMSPREIREIGGEPLHQRGTRRIDPDAAAHTRAMLDHDGSHLGGEAQHGTCITQHGQAGGGGLDPVGPTQHQLRPRFVLEHADAPARGRCRHVQPLGGPAQALRLAHGGEEAERNEVMAAHGDTLHWRHRDHARAKAPTLQHAGAAVQMADSAADQARGTGFRLAPLFDAGARGLATEGAFVAEAPTPVVR